jgi:CRP-like cAMP-binding protein
MMKADTTTVMTMLKETPFFSTLDETELDAVAKCVVSKSHPAGSVIIKEGALGECLYLVRSGLVRVEKDRGGRTIKLAELGEGAAFGEMSLIDSAPTSATVTAVEPSELLEIGRLDLNVLLNWNPILASKMWRSFSRMFSERLRDMNERMVSS